MSDFVPGVNDVVGYALGDVIPGGNVLYDALGPDFAPGINESTGGANMLGNNFAPGINESTGGANMLGNGSTWGSNLLKNLSGSALSAAQKALSGQLTGTGTGSGTGTDAGTSTGNGTGSQYASLPNITGDVLQGSSTPLFNFNPSFGNTPMSNTTQAAPSFAEGGEVPGHEPQFYSEGGLGNRYVQGDGDGTSDSVPAMLATGEFVIPADVVSSLGNGSSDSGASILDQFLASIREHKQDHNPDELPPDSEGPLSYLQKAKNKVDA